VREGDCVPQRDSGGNFAIELVESPSPSQPSWLSSDTPQLEYLQLAVGNVRMKAMIETGAEILYSYGYLEIKAPGGLVVKQRVGTRRDPVELLAFRVKDLDAAVAYYEQVCDGVARAQLPPGGVQG